MSPLFNSNLKYPLLISGGTVTEETIAMTQKAVDLLGVVQQVGSRQLRQRDAARQLVLSVRQINHLMARYRAEGPPRSGLRRLGNVLSDAVRQEVLGLVRTHYPDFGPTLTCEKLAAHRGHKLSAETLRQWMIAEGTPVGSHSSAAPTPPVSGRAGADRRLTP